MYACGQNMHYFGIIMSSSDLKVNMVGEKVNAHKFVLAARSDVWSLVSMVSTSELDLTGERHFCDSFKFDYYQDLFLVSYLLSASCTQLRSKNNTVN